MHQLPHGLTRTALAVLLSAGFAGTALGQAAAPAKVTAAKPAIVQPTAPKLSVAQIVSQHVAARGGNEAWKGLQTLQMSGKMEAGTGSMDAMAQKNTLAGKRLPAKEGTVGANVAAGEEGKQVQLPFVMDFKRPNKTRLEVEFAGKTAIQVYDGSHGWKLRPFLNRTDVEPFTAEEMRAEAARAEPEGLLVDYAAKGSTVTLEGVDSVDGQPAYRLKVAEKSGAVKHVWINASTFLDVKVDGVSRTMDGKSHDVHIYQRDFRQVDGVMIPFQLETVVDGYSNTHKLSVEKAQVNQKFDDALFAKPKA